MSPSLSQLITENQQVLYGYIYSLIGDSSTSWDILQETNIVLWRKSAEFEEGTNFKAWAFAVVRFQLLAHIRDRSREPLTLLTPELVDSFADDPERESAQFAGRLAALRKCLGGPTFQSRGANNMSSPLPAGDAPADVVAFYNLINSVADSNGTSSGITAATMTFADLVNGQEYQIQVFFNDQRSGNESRVMTYGDGTNTVALDGDAGDLGQYAVGTFTADGTTQNLTMLTNGFGNVHYNAILITAVPEPSSALLLGLVAGLGLVVRRRR